MLQTKSLFIMPLTTRTIIAAAAAAAALLAGPSTAAHERKLAGMAPSPEPPGVNS